MAELIIRPAAISPEAMSALEAGYANASSLMSQVSGVDDLTYRFPYAPVEVEFGKLSAAYEEIERPGRHSLVSRKADQLMHASFQFRIAHRPSNGLQPIEKDIEILRRMAAEDKSIAIVGLGSFFNGSQRLVTRGSITTSRTLFRIMDMSIKILRRGEDNVPWQADCDLELIEDRNPNFSTVAFSKIAYEDTVPVATATTKKGGNKKTKKNNPAPPAPTSTYSTISTAYSGGRRSGDY